MAPLGTQEFSRLCQWQHRKKGRVGSISCLCGSRIVAGVSQSGKWGILEGFGELRKIEEISGNFHISLCYSGTMNVLLEVSVQCGNNKNFIQVSE